MKLIAVVENTRFSPSIIDHVAFIDASCIGHFERNRKGTFHYFADVTDEKRLLDLANQLQYADDWFIKEWMKKSEEEIFYF